LTRAIVELGKTLKLELVAEGIERGEQLRGLQDLNCDFGQGFLFARPLGATDVDALFRSLQPQTDAA
jgi:EAL domain-containing protein (putative c-di-GMP-specific phosphodiesterase class I)